MHQALNDPASLSIGEVAEQTGISVPTLRMWEARHGFPEPARLASGHRRYTSRDCEAILDIARERQAGRTLEAAIERARGIAGTPESSIFAGVRRRRPDVEPRLVSKRALLALTRAIEDESCARAGRGMLAGSFQHERFYRASERRWRELARTASDAFVFADFAEQRRPDGGPAELPVAADAPLLREWALVADAPGFAACLVAWERPEGSSLRLFEAVWTAEPELVREASLIVLGLAERSAPDLARAAHDRLPDPARAGSETLRGATALTNRMIDYLARA